MAAGALAAAAVAAAVPVPAVSPSGQSLAASLAGSGTDAKRKREGAQLLQGRCCGAAAAVLLGSGTTAALLPLSLAAAVEADESISSTPILFLQVLQESPRVGSGAGELRARKVEPRVLLLEPLEQEPGGVVVRGALLSGGGFLLLLAREAAAQGSPGSALVRWRWRTPSSVFEEFFLGGTGGGGGGVRER